jgi:histidinol dehydrogenase
MKTYKYPSKKVWSELTTRSEIKKEVLNQQVEEILKEVKNKGDKALYNFSEKFDGVALNSLVVTEKEIIDSIKLVPEELKEAIKTAYANIERFHNNQLRVEKEVETTPGVRCWRKSVAIEKVGLYIPGGSAPLFSTILMLGIPAKIAACKEIVICTPPGKDGKINPAILFTAQLVGISTIYKVGGAQAIAAMAYGTESIPQVYKIFGPGNQYVTKAKSIIQQDGVAIDMPAGPSEVLILTDESSNPSFVAADLLSQAEHGADSQVILLSNQKNMIEKCLLELESQLSSLPREDTAREALRNSKAILLENTSQCMEFSNLYAPEHLIISTKNAMTLKDEITNAGSVFIGKYSCESAGDYASGTNHTLPTNGFAKSYSGVSVDSFVKKITFQEMTKQGLLNIGKTIELMAEAEQLMAHKNAVTIRLKEINND